MKTLLKKEFTLALHPVNVIFLAMSAFLLIPNYPYYVTFFYTSLGIFFVCLTGRENHDVDYTMLLPVRRCDLVRARIGFAVGIEAAQLLVCIPFAIISQRINRLPNMVGMEANIAFFGLAMVVLGVFNLCFFPMYYGCPGKVGAWFVISSVVEALTIVALEVATHLIPFFRRRLDTHDTVYIPEKLLVLALGAVLFGVLTLAACRISERRFERVDL